MTRGSMISMLPDANIWLSLTYNLHPHHIAAKRWFLELNSDKLHFCRITQLALLRLLTNPSAVGNGALTQQSAWQAYENLLSDSRIAFAHEPDGLVPRFKHISSRDTISPKLWTDDYLAAFAEAAGLTLVTFDKALAARTPKSTLLTP